MYKVFGLNENPLKYNLKLFWCLMVNFKILQELICLPSIVSIWAFTVPLFFQQILAKLLNRYAQVDYSLFLLTQSPRLCGLFYVSILIWQLGLEISFKYHRRL